MTLKFKTSQGLLTITDAMIDTDGTNLEEGVEVKLDGNYQCEIIDKNTYQLEDMTDEEAEQFVIENCDF